VKPDNWQWMPDELKHKDALRLLNSFRGQLLIGQALARAVIAMSEDEYPEESNIQDMEELGEVLFQPWFSLYSKQLKFT
jgi:hypothetical protein